ncbi:MAG: hypothetical protein AAF717_05870 [Bacteroidota bacterium]
MKRQLTFFLLCLLWLISCEKDSLEVLPQSSVQETALSDQSLDLSSFSKSLAKSFFTSKGLRELIKKEALRQFNMDYDVLYHMIKNIEIDDGKTVRQLILENGISEENLVEIETSIPLLTLFVPDLPNFSPQTWNIDTEIPSVASIVVGDFQIVDSDGNIIPIKSDEIPGFPVVVLKVNERVVTAGNISSLTGKLPESRLLFHEEDKFSFYFADEAFNGLDKSKNYEDLHNSTGKVTLSVDPAIITAYNSGVDWHRDNIYYGLTPNSTKGKLRNNYSEFITSIMFLGDGMSAYRKIADQTGDPRIRDGVRSWTSSFPAWTEGNFEFKVIIKINSKNGIGPEITKIFNLLGSQLFDIEYKHVGGIPPKWNISKVTAKRYSNLNIELAPWDLENYSIGWKFSVFEFDPDEEITRTFENSSQFATNFSFEFPGAPEKSKIGLKFGGSSTVTEKETYSVKTSRSSDELGDAILTFDQPVLIGVETVPTTPPLTYYLIREISTGQVSLAIEPKRVF